MLSFQILKYCPVYIPDQAQCSGLTQSKNHNSCSIKFHTMLHDLLPFITFKTTAARAFLKLLELKVD